MIVKFTVEELKKELAGGLRYAEVEIEAKITVPCDMYEVRAHIRPPQLFSPVIEGKTSDALFVTKAGELYEANLKRLVEWLMITKQVARKVDEKCVKFVEVLKKHLEEKQNEA